MKILLDENVARAIKDYLLGEGHEVSQIRPEGPLSLKNGAVYLKAKESFELFITNDRDFINPKSFPPNKTLGIVFLRVSMANPGNQVYGLKNLLAKESESTLKNRLTIVRLTDYQMK